MHFFMAIDIFQIASYMIILRYLTCREMLGAMPFILSTLERAKLKMSSFVPLLKQARV